MTRKVLVFIGLCIAYTVLALITPATTLTPWLGLAYAIVCVLVGTLVGKLEPIVAVFPPIIVSLVFPLLTLGIMGSHAGVEDPLVEFFRSYDSLLIPFLPTIGAVLAAAALVVHSRIKKT